MLNIFVKSLHNVTVMKYFIYKSLLKLIFLHITLTTPSSDQNLLTSKTQNLFLFSFKIGKIEAVCKEKYSRVLIVIKKSLIFLFSTSK